MRLEVKLLAQGHFVRSCWRSVECCAFTFPPSTASRATTEIQTASTSPHTSLPFIIPSRRRVDKTRPADGGARLHESELLQWPPKWFAGGGSGLALGSARPPPPPPVAVSPLSAAIHHGPDIWVHLQPPGLRQEGLSVCQSLSNDTRPGWPPALTQKAQAACGRMRWSKVEWTWLDQQREAYKNVLQRKKYAPLSREVLDSYWQKFWDLGFLRKRHDRAR